MSKLYLGIDPALTTGWAVLDSNGSHVAHGHWTNRAPNEGRAAEKRIWRDQLRFDTFLRNMRLVAARHGPFEMVGYEWVWRHTSTAQAQLYAGWRALLMVQALKLGVLTWPVAWSVLKSTAYAYTTDAEKTRVKKAGSQKARRAAGKALVVTAAQRRWGLTGLTDDESDALWIAEACRLGRGGK